MTDKRIGQWQPRWWGRELLGLPLIVAAQESTLGSSAGETSQRDCSLGRPSLLALSCGSERAGDQARDARMGRKGAAGRRWSDTLAYGRLQPRDAARSVLSPTRTVLRFTACDGDTGARPSRRPASGSQARRCRSARRLPAQARTLSPRACAGTLRPSRPAPGARDARRPAHQSQPASRSALQLARRAAPAS